MDEQPGYEVYLDSTRYVRDGSPTTEKGRAIYKGASETQYTVTLTKGFYMGVHLVTQDQWQAVMSKNPSCFIRNKRKLPVDTVSWEDCQEFVRKLQERDKNPYRLPTEAEWEFACRAGTTTPFSFGDTISSDQANLNGTLDHANFDGTITYRTEKGGKLRNKTTPVGSFPQRLGSVRHARKSFGVVSGLVQRVSAA